MARQADQVQDPSMGWREASHRATLSQRGKWAEVKMTWEERKGQTEER